MEEQTAFSEIMRVLEENKSVLVKNPKYADMICNFIETIHECERRKLTDFQSSVKNFFSTKTCIWHNIDDGHLYRYNLPLCDISVDEAIEIMIPGVNNPELHMAHHNGFIYYE